MRVAKTKFRSVDIFLVRGFHFGEREKSKISRKFFAREASERSESAGRAGRRRNSAGRNADAPGERATRAAQSDAASKARRK